MYASAQNIEKIGKKDMLKINGGASLSSIIYTASGITARRDPFTWFLSGSLNFSILDFSIPLTYSYSNQHGTFTQPFNQVSLTPQYKWMKGYVGYNSMSFSSYTLSGHVFLGGGLELNPGIWRISVMCGRLNKAVAYDAILESDANMAYQRMGYGIKAGVEKNGHVLHLIVFKASDSPSSIPFIPLNTQFVPQDNAVVSIIGKTKLGSHFLVEGEYALSGLTRNILSNEHTHSKIKNQLPLLFKTNSTSQFFGAGNFAIGYQEKLFNFQLKYERVAPDCRTLGAYYFNNDMENITAAPSFNLLQGKLNLAFNSGFQRNNLDNTKLNNTRRFVNAINASLMLTKKLSLNASCSNFSSYTKVRLQSDPFYYNTLDTLNFYQVSQTANAGFNYNFGSTGIKNSIVFSSSYQVSGQKSATVEQHPSVVYSGNMGYNRSWVPLKTTLGISLNYNQSVIEVLSTSYWGPTLSFARSFVNNKLRTSIGGTFNQVLVDGKSNSNLINVRASMNYALPTANAKYGKSSMGIICSYLNRLPSYQNVIRYNELTISANLNHSF